jgi:hypothetical protein
VLKVSPALRQATGLVPHAAAPAESKPTSARGLDVNARC